jgi:hypothetical protein
MKAISVLLFFLGVILRCSVLVNLSINWALGVLVNVSYLVSIVTVEMLNFCRVVGRRTRAYAAGTLAGGEERAGTFKDLFLKIVQEVINKKYG